ncbi:MAG: hypothetical protein AAF065_10930 [Verrucomicrobiota bacterium]
MSRSKKPVIIVAIAFGAIIFLPIILLMISRIGGGGGTVSPGVIDSPPVGNAEVVDFDLSQIAEKAEKLLSEDLADALRKGDISLDFMAGLKKEADKAREDMRDGKLRRAKERYASVVDTAEGELATIAAADRARALKDATYEELQRLDFLRSAFENTYREAVENYNKALRGMESGDYVQSVADFELAGAILGDLEARSIQQIANLLEAAQISLEKYELKSARQAYEAVLDIDTANADATEGLTMISALEGIAEQVKAIRALEDAGQLEEALAALESLSAEQPNNPFIRNQRASIEARILENEFKALVDSSVQAETAGDLEKAITELEAALKLKSDPTQQARLAKLEEQYKAARLEMLLADGFQALKDGRYEAARNLYKEAVALNPESKEARTGLEKASSLYLANIRYSQNIKGAERYIKEGRYPLAAKLFNEAMTSRPATIVAAQLQKESQIRSTLEAQSKEVPVEITSDGRTYVSIIGVLPPKRLKSSDLTLFPDVYKVRGTRKGYSDVEFDLKVDATLGRQAINVQCTQKI